MITTETAAGVLDEYGLTLPCDPRWIVAAHMCEYGEAVTPTIRTVMQSCRLCAKRTHEDNEALARSYGL